jgi:hypothetical protein
MGEICKECLENAENFFKCKIPADLGGSLSAGGEFKALDRQAIEKIVDFQSPFLRTDKMIIFGNECVGSTSIGIGKVYPRDMEGHYNSTVYLAFAGRLMPSTSTIHLAYFYPDTAPQAVEGRSIRLDDKPFNGGLLQAAPEGTTFYVKTVVTRKKLSLVEVETEIMFGAARFGLIEGLKFVLTRKDSIFRAVVPSEVV